MKKDRRYRPRRIVIIATFCFLHFNVFISNSSAQKIVLVTGEWSPYTTSLDDNISSGTGGGYGLLTEIISVALQEMEVHYGYEFRPWSDVLDLLRKNEYQYAFPYRRTPDREKEFIFSDPLFTGRTMLFCNLFTIPDPSEIHDVNDLRSYRIGFVKGYARQPELEEAASEFKLLETEFLAFEELVDGTIDVLPAERVVGQRILQRYFPNSEHRVGKLPDFRYPDRVHLIALKENAEAAQFIERFNESLRKLRSSGIHRELISCYDVMPDSFFQVRLIGPSSFPLAIGTVKTDDKKGFLIPRGTRAVVVEWHKSFTEESDFDIHTDVYSKSRVKILEGPLKDHLLYVPNMFLSFE